VTREYNGGQQQHEEASHIRRGLLWEIIETALLAVLIFLAVRIAFQNFRVQGTSMFPTLHNGDFVLINKADYLLHSPQRGDIVVFKYPLNPRQDFIKRVIGLPGNIVRIANGRVYINGHPLKEPYIDEPTDGTYGPVRVPQSEYFVLGDNRNDSWDSRGWGFLPRSDIIGKALVAYWPPSDFKFFSATIHLPSL
jgi:signal peptidase I